MNPRRRSLFSLLLGGLAAWFVPKRGGAAWTAFPFPVKYEPLNTEPFPKPFLDLSNIAVAGEFILAEVSRFRKELFDATGLADATRLLGPVADIKQLQLIRSASPLYNPNLTILKRGLSSDERAAEQVVEYVVRKLAAKYIPSDRLTNPGGTTDYPDGRMQSCRYEFDLSEANQRYLATLLIALSEVAAMQPKTNGPLFVSPIRVYLRREACMCSAFSTYLYADKPFDTFYTD